MIYPTSSIYGTLWYVYLLECQGGSVYAGITTDVERRYKEHCTGKGAKYTRANPPTSIAGSVPVGDKSTALKWEHRLKKVPSTQKRIQMAVWVAAYLRAVAEVRETH